MSNKNYRCYFTDAADRIRSFEQIECANDTEAALKVDELLASIARVVREEGMSAIIVEQSPRLVLPITQRAIVLDRGTVVHEGSSADLLTDRARLDQWLAVMKR